MIIYGIDITDKDGKLWTINATYQSKERAEKQVEREKQKKWVKTAELRTMWLFEGEENEEN